jgi:hypothetical protein
MTEGWMPTRPRSKVYSALLVPQALLTLRHTRLVPLVSESEQLCLTFHLSCRLGHSAKFHSPLGREPISMPLVGLQSRLSLQ